MRESCTYGSVRGAISNGRSYRDWVLGPMRESLCLMGSEITQEGLLR